MEADLDRWGSGLADLNTTPESVFAGRRLYFDLLVRPEKVIILYGRFDDLLKHELSRAVDLCNNGVDYDWFQTLDTEHRAKKNRETHAKSANGARRFTDPCN